jgi:hypothetical protein
MSDLRYLACWHSNLQWYSNPGRRDMNVELGRDGLFLPGKRLDLSFAGRLCPLGPCDITVGITGYYLAMVFIGIASRVVKDDSLLDIQVALIEDESR